MEHDDFAILSMEQDEDFPVQRRKENGYVFLFHKSVETFVSLNLSPKSM